MTHLLVIEDDQHLSRTLELSLQAEGYDVDVYMDGEDGRDVAVSKAYDCIIVDWMLPSMTGIEIVKSIRAQKIQTPILMLTGRSTPKDKVAGLDEGADDYLSKPFSSQELFARLRAIQRRRSKASKQIIVYDDVVLDVSAHTLQRGGAAVKLMPKEFELLTYFMRNPDVALRRDVILHDIWGITPQHSSNRLDVHVRRLRQKIHTRDEADLIHTVRGIGYRFGL